MFRRKIKIVSLIMSMSLCVSMFSVTKNVFAEENESYGYDLFEEMIEDELINDIVEKESDLTTGDDKIKTVSDISDMMIEEDVEDSIYDDYEDSYAGEYIDDEGNIVVLSLDKDNTEQKLKDMDEVSVVEVENSLDSLLEKKQAIDSRILEIENSNVKSHIEEKFLSNLSGLYVDVEKNAVVVELRDISEDTVNIFKEVIADYDEVIFEKNSVTKDCATGLQLGRAIYTKSSPNTVSRSSIGYPALYYNSKGEKIYGFITCAHGKSKGDIVYLDSSCTTKVGMVVKWHLAGKVDASFVKITNSSYTTSRKVLYKNNTGKTGGVTITGQSWYYGKDSSIANYNPAKGEKAWKSGSTTYLTSGKIISTWASTTTETGTITDVYKTDISVSGGDSGGVFYQKDDIGEYSVMGIVKSTGSGYSNFVRIENIQKTLGLYILGYDLYHGKKVK